MLMVMMCGNGDDDGGDSCDDDGYGEDGDV